MIKKKYKTYATKKTTTVPGEMCSFGEQSQAVANVQAWLIAHGYYIPAGVTSYYGSWTKNAVKKFQYDNFIFFNGGRDVGPITLRRMQAINSYNK